MTLSGDMRDFRATRWSSMSHSAEIGPSRILLSRDLRVMLSAVALEWGKFSESIRADAKISYKGINEECRVRAEEERRLTIQLAVDGGKFRQPARNLGL